jgi:hypothetical protein
LTFPVESHPGRFTKPTEVAALVPLLASDLVAGNIAGADFVIDGCLNPEQRAGPPYVVGVRAERADDAE